MIAIIVARAENNVIGRKNDLPWHLPADLKHFKAITTGHTVVMGRNTFDSIYQRLKGPLPDRHNIVVSRSLASVPEGFMLARSLDDALETAKSLENTCFIIGGQQIYQESLDCDLVDAIYLTEVHASIDGDTYFPELNKTDWQETERQNHKKDDKNPYDYSFVTLKRMRA